MIRNEYLTSNDVLKFSAILFSKDNLITAIIYNARMRNRIKNDNNEINETERDFA
jgi:hypothetical protein